MYVWRQLLLYAFKYRFVFCFLFYFQTAEPFNAKKMHSEILSRSLEHNIIMNYDVSKYISYTPLCYYGIFQHGKRKTGDNRFEIERGEGRIRSTSFGNEHISRTDDRWNSFVSLVLRNPPEAHSPDGIFVFIVRPWPVVKKMTTSSSSGRISRKTERKSVIIYITLYCIICSSE